MKKERYENVMIKIVITDNLDILTESGDGGIDFEGQEGWGLGTFSNN